MAEIILRRTTGLHAHISEGHGLKFRVEKKSGALLASPLRERRFQPAHDSM
jgi:hypothetical protein